MSGTSKRKQKALLHRERKENATNTCRLEIQKVIVLDINKWLGVFSFTVKLVSEIMVAF